MVDDKEAEIESLKEAMALFTTTARSLERSHETLRGRVAELTREVSTLQNRLEKVLSGISDGVVACDASGSVTTANAAAREIGITEGVQLDRTPQAAAAPVLLPLLQQAMAGSLPRFVEAEVSAPSGEARILSISADPLQDEEGDVTGAVASFRDITELRHLQQDLERKERLALLGQMAASIAHEVRNPLGGIRIYLGLAGRNVQKNGGRVEEALAEIEKGVAEIDRIIADVLTFARDMKPRPAPFKLRPVVDGVTASLVERTPADVLLKNEVEEGLVLNADAGLVERALTNLVLNALQAVGEEGTVTVAARCSENCAEVVVSDSGTGLDGEACGRAFEPFFTSRADGTGLGLAIVERIAEAHGGSAYIRNAGEKGAEAGIVFPKGALRCSG